MLTSLQVSDLWTLRCASIHAGALDSGRLAVVIRHLLHLLCQLTCRSQNQALHGNRGWANKDHEKAELFTTITEFPNDR